MYIKPLEKEKYIDYINRILQSRCNIRDKEDYQEQHHITPKCLGGLDNCDNLIFLYAEEHYYAHKLLAEENQDNSCLLLAWWNMCQCTQNGERKYNITAEDYALARKNFVNTMQGNQYAKGNKLSEETRNKMSMAHKGKLTGPDNPMYGKHCSEKCKKKLRCKLSGANNPASKKVQCVETGRIFNTVKSATEWANISHSDISACIAGRQKSAGKDPITGVKLHWVYVE